MAKVATMTSEERGPMSKVKQLGSFFADVRNEMRKVTFPGRKEVQATTVVVIITVIIFGVYFYVIDRAIGSGIQWVLRHSR